MVTVRAVRADEVRRQNLSSVASLIHLFGQLSRAELTARLGLNRSTIGVLVSELCELGVLTEGLPRTRSGAGRPSYMVGPSPNGPFVLAIDIDVNRLAVAAVGLGGRVLGRCDDAIPTTRPDDVAVRVIDVIAAVMTKVPPGAWLAGVGISVPGTVSSNEARIDLAPNLEWRDVDLKNLLVDHLAPGTNLRIGNDADLGVRAEHVRGAAQHCDDVLYVHGRIGIGGGIISEGRPLHGMRGFAGEIGHTVIDPAGARCHCGGRGCLETVIGEQHLIEQAGRSGERSAAVRDLLADHNPEPQALRAIQTVCDWLGMGLANAAALLNPQVIVLGGYLSQLMPLYGARVQAVFARVAMPAIGHGVEVRAATLGADSALVGAGELAFERFLIDPAAARGALATR